MNDKASPSIEQSTQSRNLKYYLIGGAVILTVVLAYVVFGGRGGTSKLPVEPTTEAEEPVPLARTELNKSVALNTCREALAQINQHLGKHPATDLWRLTPAEKTVFAKLPDGKRQSLWKGALQSDLPAAHSEALGKLNDEQRERLRKAVESELTGEPGEAQKDEPRNDIGLPLEPLAFALSTAFRSDFLKRHGQLKDDEWAEVNSGVFTLLDGQHLDLSFLMRDVAASFTREGVLLGNQPLEQAKAAFAWAVRQVRLQDSREQPGEPLPPQFVVRRGFGTAVERALVFLALLQQFDVPGCFVALAEEGDRLSLWTCGVLVDDEIYLFDPRMGLPLPGPDDQGIATLAGVQSKPELLKQLWTKDGPAYDVTAEQARKAQVLVVWPLSAQAPRMRYLEKILQDPDTPAPVVGGRVALDTAQSWSLFEMAVKKLEEKDRAPLKSWPLANHILRAVLPPDEGGTDKSQPPRWVLLHQRLAPLASFPQQLNPKEMGKIGQIMLERFGTPFVEFLTSPQQPRDHVLRGRFSEASAALTNIRQEIIKQKARFEADKQLAIQVQEALRELRDTQADLQRLQRQAGAGAANDPLVQAASARMDDAWKKSLGILDVLIEGNAAGPRGTEVNFQLALCKHEQAERLQLHLDETVRAGKSPTKAEEDEAHNAWQNAAEWWTTYLQEYADAPTAPSARFHAARTRLMLSERVAAIELLKDTSGKMTDWEKTGRLVLARQLEQKPE
jgi:hypothetical protein